MSKAKTLLQIYQKMLDALGPQQWWPGETAFEVIIGAILTQNTNWSNVEKAIKNLKAAGKLGTHEIHQLSEAELAQLIRPSGFLTSRQSALRRLSTGCFPVIKETLRICSTRSYKHCEKNCCQ